MLEAADVQLVGKEKIGAACVTGPRLSKWGLKLIRRVQAERRQATQ